MASELRVVIDQDSIDKAKAQLIELHLIVNQIEATLIHIRELLGMRDDPQG